MTTDVIYYSDNSFTCAGCEKRYDPGTLVNVFRWDDKMLLYCMECLQKMDFVCEDMQWEAHPKKDPRMKEDGK